jgi:hypothetical protein
VTEPGADKGTGNAHLTNTPPMMRATPTNGWLGEGAPTHRRVETKYDRISESPTETIKRIILPVSITANHLKPLAAQLEVETASSYQPSGGGFSNFAVKMLAKVGRESQRCQQHRVSNIIKLAAAQSSPLHHSV